ncbi:MAG: hypothetical protein WD669_00615 [Pirellulales bacterium]
MILATGLGFVSDARSEIVRLKLTGAIVVGDSHNILPEDIVTGENFLAYWSYDTSVPDSLPELPYAGRYVHPLADPLTSDYGLSVRINGHVFYLNTSVEPFTIDVGVGRLGPADSINGGDGIATNQTDVIAPFEYRSATTIEDRINLFFYDSFFSTIADSSLETDALPAIVDPSEFASAKVRIDGFGSVAIGQSLPPSFNIEGFIENVEIVPEPSTICLVLTVLVLLPRRRACRGYESHFSSRRAC